MVVKAAQMEGMTVVPEGGSLFTQDVTLIQDGNSTVEHNIPLDIFYKDLVQLWGQTEVDYTPTLVVTYGGPAGDPYWRAHTNLWEHPTRSEEHTSELQSLMRTPYALYCLKK